MLSEHLRRVRRELTLLRWRLALREMGRVRGRRETSDTHSGSASKVRRELVCMRATEIRRGGRPSGREGAAGDGKKMVREGRGVEDV